MTRARHFQFKPDGEVTFMMAQDAVGLPAPLMQVCPSATLFYAYAPFWMRSLLVSLMQVCLSAKPCPATLYRPFPLHSVACLFHAGMPSPALCPATCVCIFMNAFKCLSPSCRSACLPTNMNLSMYTRLLVYQSLTQAAFVFALLLYWVVWLSAQVSYDNVS